ncbi:helix-turn-helix domain-containing protein [Enterocloster lavalensis]|uniref:helix-turn-helix domain-containing protein n=1 Tax=Enterocloster lavalensis TaxID=460384 RepID=UPI0039842D47
MGCFFMNEGQVQRGFQFSQKVSLWDQIFYRYHVQLQLHSHPPLRSFFHYIIFPALRGLCQQPQFAQKLGLTKREREILDLLLKDRTNQEICGELVISLGTVKTHVHNILQKAEVTKRTQLMEQFRAFVQKR